MDTPPSYTPEGAKNFRAPKTGEIPTSETQQKRPDTLRGFSVGDVIKGKKIIKFDNDDGVEVAVLLGPSESNPEKFGVKRVPIELLLQRQIDQTGDFKIGDRVAHVIDSKAGNYEIQGFMVVNGEMKALIGYASENGKAHDVNANWVSVAELDKGEKLN